MTKIGRPSWISIGPKQIKILITLVSVIAVLLFVIMFILLSERKENTGPVASADGSKGNQRESSPSKGNPKDQTSTGTAQTSLELIEVKGGTFMMGCSRGQSNCETDELPTRRVTLNSFFIAKTEVTVEQFSTFIVSTGYSTDADRLGKSIVWSPEGSKVRSNVNWECDVQGRRRGQSEMQHPVIHVSWNDAVAFCNWLSEKDGLQKAYTGSGSNIEVDLSANGYRLPTEAEWEFAARGGTRSSEYEYCGGNDLASVAWFKNNSGTNTNPVALKEPNELGLYDMSGNVWEWCWDIYAPYSSQEENNPKGGYAGAKRTLRGGSWSLPPAFNRVTNRDSYAPVMRNFNGGFRVARSGR